MRPNRRVTQRTGVRGRGTVPATGRFPKRKRREYPVVTYVDESIIVGKQKNE